MKSKQFKISGMILLFKGKCNYIFNCILKNKIQYIRCFITNWRNAIGLCWEENGSDEEGHACIDGEWVTTLIWILFCLVLTSP